MKPTEISEPMDWHERLHSLPSGATPATPVERGFLRAALSVGLFVAGSVFGLLAGGCAGLSLGIGPDQTGGGIYGLLGIVLNLLAGAAMAALVARRFHSRATTRLVFYSFTAPAFLAFAFFAFSLAARMIGR